MEIDSWNRGAFFQTVRITVPDHKNQEDSVGTGFLLGFPIIEPNGNENGTIMLVSNRHVFKEWDGRLILNFHQKREDGQGPVPGPGISIDEDFSGSFVTHPDPDIDLAAVGVSKLALRQDIFFFYEGPGSLLDSGDPTLYPGQDVFFVGYPDGHFDHVNNLPIMRFGKIATLPQADYRGEPVFLIDAPVVEGSSGSAVYTYINNERKLIGVVSKYYYRDLPVEFNGPSAMTYAQLLDIGVVIKTSALWDLIHHLIETELPGCRLAIPDDEILPSGT